MTTQNKLPEYRSLSAALTQQGIALTAAEIHGLISGILCGGNIDQSWQTVLYNLTNEGVPYPMTLAKCIDEIYATTRQMLEEDDFAFHLFLPTEENITLFDRADALSAWTNHFLLGLGMVQPKLSEFKGDVAEVISDLRNIAQLGYDQDEDQNVLERALEEVVEYVRIAAMLCHSEFSPLSTPVQKPQQPILH